MSETSLEIIAVTYGHGFKLKCFIDSIRSQTDPNWCVHIIHDGAAKIFDDLKQDLSKNGYLNDPRIQLSCTPKRYNDWGHSLREYGLKNRISDASHITITNCDNYYVPIWISEVNNASKNNDFIYWDCILNYKQPGKQDRPFGYGALSSKLSYSNIDMGAACVKSSIATKVGFPFRNQAADWSFFKKCLEETNKDRTHKINKILFVHN